MGRVECLSLPGRWEAWINSDDHDPPHLHVERPGEWIVKVRFMVEPAGIEVVWRAKARVPRAKERKLLRQQARAHRLQLFREWEQKAHVKTKGEDR